MRYSLILILLVLCSCSKKRDEDLYLGELYFSPFRIGSFYNLEEDLRLKVEQTMDTSRIEKADSVMQMTIALYRKLKQKQLLYKPYVDLRLKDSSFVKLYLDSSDYARIKIYKRQDLVDSNKKVVIWGRTEALGELGFPFLYCAELVDVQLTEGQTLPAYEGKFRIDDYQ